jgi:hypothetical protein
VAVIKFKTIGKFLIIGGIFISIVLLFIAPSLYLSYDNITQFDYEYGLKELSLNVCLSILLGYIFIPISNIDKIQKYRWSLVVLCYFYVLYWKIFETSYITDIAVLGAIFYPLFQIAKLVYFIVKNKKIS